MAKIFGFPREWEIDRNIPKETIYKIALADDKLKRIFIDNVEKIKLLYSLKSDNTNIEKYIKDNEKYEEINILKVILREKNKEKVIIELLHQLIPKPTVVLLEFKNEIILSASNKKITNRVVLEEIFSSKWSENNDKKFLEFDYRRLNSGNLKEFYESIIEKIRKMNLGIDNSLAKEKIIIIENLNKEIEELKLMRKKQLK